MSGFPTQLPWRRFACLLRDLGYRPLKSHRGSVRQFFNPTRSPNLVSFHNAMTDKKPVRSSPETQRVP